VAPHFEKGSATHGRNSADIRVAPENGCRKQILFLPFIVFQFVMSGKFVGIELEKSNFKDPCIPSNFHSPHMENAYPSAYLFHVIIRHAVFVLIFDRQWFNWCKRFAAEILILFLQAVVQQDGVHGMQGYPQNLDLSKIRAKSLKIRAKMATNVGRKHIRTYFWR